MIIRRTVDIVVSFVSLSHFFRTGTCWIAADGLSCSFIASSVSEHMWTHIYFTAGDGKTCNGPYKMGPAGWNERGIEAKSIDWFAVGMTIIKSKSCQSICWSSDLASLLARCDFDVIFSLMNLNNNGPLERIICF